MGRCRSNPRVTGHQWSGCNVRIRLQLRLPHSLHCPLSMSFGLGGGGGAYDSPPQRADHFESYIMRGNLFFETFAAQPIFPPIL